MQRKNLMLLSLIAIAVGAFGCGDDSPTSVTGAADDGTQAGLPNQGTVLRLLGDAAAYDGTVPDIDNDGVDDAAACFDVDILDAKGRKIGTATDCLSNITTVGDGMSLVGTTTFRLDNGSFVARGYTTVQPVTTSAPTPVTHATGAIPMDDANGIIDGTDAYSGFRAQVRLSGAVNLSRLESEGRIAFDCLFHVSPLP